MLMQYIIKYKNIRLQMLNLLIILAVEIWRDIIFCTTIGKWGLPVVYCGRWTTDQYGEVLVNWIDHKS